MKKNVSHQERDSKIEGRAPRHELHSAKRNVALVGTENKRYEARRNGNNVKMW